MARFTIEDCMEKIDNRFDLTLAAVLRARQITKQSHTLVELEENDKPTVLALREISDGLINKEILKSIT